MKKILSCAMGLLLAFAMGTRALGVAASAQEVPLTLFPAYLQVPLGQHVTLDAKAAGNKSLH